ncbi:MAG TPA: hypothetical protein VGI39_01470 [Polyangiaceae bacterium]|jgi:hypothetical protein
MRATTELDALRHVSGSGDLSRWWEFIPAGGFPSKPARLLLSVRIASAPAVECEVPVCTNARPIVGSWIVVRVDEYSWRLTPAVWRGEDALGDVATVHPSLPLGSVLLTGAPAHVSEEIGKIGESHGR